MASEATERFDPVAALRAHARRSSERSIPELIAADPGRVDTLSVAAGPLRATFARQRYDRAALDALLSIADDADLQGAMRALLGGDTVNPTEQRAALHTALRGVAVDTPVARQAHADAAAARTRMRALVDGLAATDVTDIVSIGIGGSDLGPRLVADALALPGARFRVHYLSNVDGAAAQRVLAGIDPARTAAILVSKTFGTQETLLNGAIVRDWLGDHATRDGGRLFGVSANVERAAAFGIDPGRILPMWDWVGGRYSLWSAVGFPIALAVGMDRFEALLAGAAAFDRHVLEAPAASNLAMLHALTAVWNRNGLGAASHAVLPYDERLRLLPAYLQQLVMGVSASAPGSMAARSRPTPSRCGGAAPAPTCSTASSRRCTKAPTPCRPTSSGWPSPAIRTTPTAMRCTPTCWRRPKRWPTGKRATTRIATTRAAPPARCCCSTR